MFHEIATDQIVLVADVIQEQQPRIFHATGGDDEEPRGHGKRFALQRTRCDTANGLVKLIPFYPGHIGMQDSRDCVCLADIVPIAGAEAGRRGAVLVGSGPDSAIDEWKSRLVAFL